MVQSLEFGCQNSPLLGTNGFVCICACEKRWVHASLIKTLFKSARILISFFHLCTVKLMPMDQTVICDLLSKLKMTVEGFNG